MHNKKNNGQIMEKTVTHRDIAKYLNINQATVSRALSPDKSHLCSEETRKRIQEAAEHLGFRADINARRISCKRSEAFTFVLDNLHFQSDVRLFEQDNVLLECLRGIMDGAGKIGYDVKILPVRPDAPGLEDYVEERIGYPYSDGVIFLGAFHLRKLRVKLDERRFPYIVLQMFEDEILQPPCIINDHEPGYRAIFASLASQKIEKIVYSCLYSDGPYKLYYTRFARIMHECLPECALEVCRTPDYPAFRRESAPLISRLRKSAERSAIAAMTPALASMWENELRFNGIDPVKELPLISIGCNSMQPKIATLRFQIAECGETAVRLLHHAVVTRSLPPPVVTRIPGIYSYETILQK